MSTGKVQRESGQAQLPTSTTHSIHAPAVYAVLSIVQQFSFFSVEKRKCVSWFQNLP